MLSKYSSPRARLHLAAAIIMVVGVLAAVGVYIAAARSDAPAALGYRMIGGQAYAIGADASSREMQQLERLGGKAAVQTFRLQLWIDSLWHGQRLAYTLIVLSAAAAWLCWHIANLMDEGQRA
jgi:hypothetical protein